LVLTFKHKSVMKLLFPIGAMGFVILVSNTLVQYPLSGNFLGIDLSAILTWGAFTYPIAFLVTDSTNRVFGCRFARRVVAFGFAFGVALTLLAALGIAMSTSRDASVSIWQAFLNDPDSRSMLRIALASGTAFLVAQLVNIKIFDMLRQTNWWKAPTASSFTGSLIDTVIFFSIAFVGTGVPWASWAIGDFGAKLLMMILLLYPFKILVGYYPNSLRFSNELV
jgi:queuosine precursor transporter